MLSNKSMIPIIRRRVYDNKPYDAEVEWITFTGTQFINIPINPSDATDAIEFEFRRTATTNQVRLCRTESDDRFQLYINGSNGASYNTITTGGSSTWTALNNKYNKPGVVRHTWKVDYKNNKTWLDFDEYPISNSRSKATSTGRLQIAQLHSSYTRFKGYIYHVRFWRNDELIFDLIPVRKDGIGYLYDKISGEMYGNDGTGNIGVGIDKCHSLLQYTQLDYIENNTFTSTSPYIDASFANYTGAIDMTMSVKWNTIDSEKRQLMGANYGPFWGCENGEYGTSAVKSGVVPSTTEFETVSMNTYTNTPAQKGSFALFRIFESRAKENTITTYVCSCKIAWCKIWVGGELVRDYVPVRHPSGTVGMFDRVEDKFYFSANSGSFIGG